jgi:hypothetical protein
MCPGEVSHVCCPLPTGWIYLYGRVGVFLGFGRARNHDELAELLKEPRSWVLISGTN